MRILVTGSHGVIGQSLVPALAEHRVISFDIRRDPSMDVTDADAVADIFIRSRPDLCIHMAAQVGRLNGEDFPHMSVESNVIGTLNIAEACTEQGVRLINFSTSEVYGHNSLYGSPDILAQNGMYGITKLAAEGVVKHYCDTYGLKAVSVRPFMVYGPHETPGGPFRSAVSNFLAAAHNGEHFEAHEGCVRSWCYVDDFVDGLSLLFDEDFDAYEAFSIGTEEYRSMEECARIVADVVGRGDFDVVAPPAQLVSSVKKADFSKMKAMGFCPKVGLEEGVERTYEWMLSKGVLS